jgi:hypothetical protein
VNITFTTTADQASRRLRALARDLLRGQSRLLRLLALAGQKDVVARMDNQNGGTWAPLSHWGIAKGKNKPLQGMSSKVKGVVKQNQALVQAELPPSRETGKAWSLTQHHKGFQNAPPSGGVVTIRVQRPEALGIGRDRTRFSFIHRRAGVTPGRKIWPSRIEAEKNIVMPVASRWLKQIVEKV